MPEKEHNCPSLAQKVAVGTGVGVGAGAGVGVGVGEGVLLAVVNAELTTCVVPLLRSTLAVMVCEPAARVLVLKGVAAATLPPAKS